jgi:predicted phage baseplate assembly protein
VIVTAPVHEVCGCCGVAPEEAALTNPPGQTVLAYRGGTQTSVFRRMLARLAEELPELTARELDDPAIALLDAWATVADVINFYQERIVNEGFLRTATERASVLELARAFGYELRPGVAASTYLRFAVESVPGAPAAAKVADRTKVRSVPGQGEQAQTFETSSELSALADLNEVGLRTREPQQIGPGTTRLYLDGTTTGLRPGDAILVIRSGPAGVRREFRILRTVELRSGATLVRWDTMLSGEPPSSHDQVRVYAFRLRASIFGQNAPDWRTIPDQVRSQYLPPGGVLANFTNWPRFGLPTAGGVVDLDAAYPAVGRGSWLVLSQAQKEPAILLVNEAQLAGADDFGITGRTTQVKLCPDTDLSKFDRREVAVFTQSERLELAEQPIERPLTGRALELERTVPLAERSPVFIVGETVAGDPVVQLSTAAAVAGAIVTLDADLQPGLRRDSVRLLGNVVPATHGETVTEEVLGSGDGTLTHQRFTLSKPELTHVSAQTASGIVSTLDVRVDGVLWTQVPSLFLAGPQDRVYVVRIDNDARATVIFGDGIRGARLPSGQENVRARYRSGIGPAGRVSADSLTLLPQRPFGIATVTNPLQATGGVAPEKLAEARVNAPLTVLTLDRVVSLRDHEDFARAFGGIAKAHAVALPVGATVLVHLTVAAADGATVDNTTVSHLRDAIASFGGTPDRLRVDSVRPNPFVVEVAVLADPALLRSAVDEAVRAAVRTAFAADRRSFGQPVTAAEVITTVQAVPGVVAATLTALHRPNKVELREVLVARDARLDPTEQAPDRILPAELLVIDPDQIALTVMLP